MNLNLNTIVWLCGAFLALASFVKLATARTVELQGRLRDWLTEELTSLQKRRSLFETVRKKRQEMKLRKEEEMRIAEQEIKQMTGRMGQDQKKAA